MVFSTFPFLPGTGTRTRGFLWGHFAGLVDETPHHAGGDADVVELSPCSKPQAQQGAFWRRKWFAACLLCSVARQYSKSAGPLFAQALVLAGPIGSIARGWFGRGSENLSGPSLPSSTGAGDRLMAEKPPRQTCRDKLKQFPWL